MARRWRSDSVGIELPGGAVPFHDDAVAPHRDGAAGVVDPAGAERAGVGGGIGLPAVVGAVAAQERAALTGDQRGAAGGDVDVVEVAAGAEAVERCLAGFRVVADGEAALAHGQKRAVGVAGDGAEGEAAADGAVDFGDGAGGQVEAPDLLARADDEGRVWRRSRRRRAGRRGQGRGGRASRRRPAPGSCPGCRRSPRRPRARRRRR
jgi:hypothetical protein